MCVYNLSNRLLYEYDSGYNMGFVGKGQGQHMLNNRAWTVTDVQYDF